MKLEDKLEQLARTSFERQLLRRWLAGGRERRERANGAEDSREGAPSCVEREPPASGNGS